MAKSTDFPIAIREFGMTISKFSHRHYDYDIFQDFIDYMICCLLWNGHPETVERLKKKYEDDYPKFFELYKSFLNCQMKNLGDDASFDWYDVLGEIYEAISSSSKASALGQFFTPKPVCDAMASIITPIDKELHQGKTLKVNDCACGSGRTLLAFNKIYPGQELYGEDLDPICTKMATINLCLHGCKRQICNMNSLSQDWYFGYQINPWLHSLNGYAHIIPISESQSYSKLQIPKKEEVQPTPVKEKTINKQLTLFE